MLYSEIRKILNRGLTSNDYWVIEEIRNTGIECPWTIVDLMGEW